MKKLYIFIITLVFMLLANDSFSQQTAYANIFAVVIAKPVTIVSDTIKTGNTKYTKIRIENNINNNVIYKDTILNKKMVIVKVINIE